MIMVLAPTKKKSEAMAEQRRARTSSDPAGGAGAADAARTPADAAPEATAAPDAARAADGAAE
jgi:translation initiation factor IF-3